MDFAPAPLTLDFRNCSALEPSDPEWAASDCGGALAEACLSQQWCPRGECDPLTRRAIADFLGCYEAPLSELDGVPNATTLQPCIAAAGLDADAVAECTSGAAGAAALRACEQRAAAELDLGLGLPYITAAGRYYGDDPTSLVAEACHHLRGRPDAPAECDVLPLALAVTISCATSGPGNYSYFTIEHAFDGVEAALALAARQVLANATFPTNWGYWSEDYGSQIKAVSSASIGAAGDIEQYYTCPIVWEVDVLRAYAPMLTDAVTGAGFARLLASHLNTTAGLPGIDPGWIDVHALA